MVEIFLDTFNRSIAASWIVLSVIALRLLLKKAPKWITVLLWAVVAVRLLCPFTIESVLSLIPSRETVSPSIMLEETPAIQSGLPVINAVVNPVIGQTFAPKPTDSVNPLQIVVPVLGAVWLVGILGMLLYAIISWQRLRRKLKTAILLRDNVYQSENAASPFVLGILKPKIYLPFHMDTQDATYVVAHEQAHIRRKDHLWKPLGYLLLAIHWFNPLMWMGYLLLCRDIELACDEKVVKDLDFTQKADYSQALLACSINRRIIAACPLAFGEVGVKERVKSVLKYKKPALWIVAVAVAVCALFAGCFLTDRLNKGEMENLNDWQRSAVKNYPEQCGLDSAKGLDVYAIELQKGIYEYYLTSHKEVPYTLDSPEIIDADFVGIISMQDILYTYDVAEKDIHIIILPWENPDTGFVSEYFSELSGETPAERDKRQAKYISDIRYRLLDEPYDLSSTWIVDQIVADIDGDGEEERCYIVNDGRAGNFPYYRFLAREPRTKKWKFDNFIKSVNGKDGRYESISFAKDAQEKIYITASWKGDSQETREIHRFDLKIEHKHIEFLNCGKTDISNLNAMQAELMMRFPEYFGLDYTNGLDVYVWQMAKYSYSFGLLPHSDTPREWICDDTMTLMNKGNLNAEQMRAILATYPIGEEAVYIIPWQNPLSSYLPDWLIVEEGIDRETTKKVYVEEVRQMLFEPQANTASLLFTEPSLSWVISEVPDVFIKDGRLLCTAEGGLPLGTVTEFTLTKDAFPNLISGYEGLFTYVVEGILQNNSVAYEVHPATFSSSNLSVNLYYVLEQKDGSTILVYGHYANNEKNDFIRWIFRINE